MDLKYFESDILQNGFVTVSNLLSEKEIAKLRQLIEDHMRSDFPVNFNLGKAQAGAACIISELGWIYYHPKVLSVMRKLLQTDEIMFTSHCDVHSRILSNWHKDDGMGGIEGGYFEQPCYNVDDCRVYKMAIYLQDHVHNLGGLRVRRKSHRSAGCDLGEEIYLKTKAGDAIVFDVRLTHSGQMDIVPLPFINKPLNFLLGVFRKIFHTRILDIAVKNLYDRIAGEKMSIFFTYGLPNDYTIKFSRNSMRRQLSQHPSLPIYLPDALRQKLIENQVLLAEDYFSNLKPLEVNKC